MLDVSKIKFVLIVLITWSHL